MVHRYIVTVEELADAIRGIRRAMLNGNRSDEYNLATEDFAAAFSDMFGIGEIDGKGDLRNIGVGSDCISVSTHLLYDARSS